MNLDPVQDVTFEPLSIALGSLSNPLYIFQGCGGPNPLNPLSGYASDCGLNILLFQFST